MSDHPKQRITRRWIAAAALAAVSLSACHAANPPAAKVEPAPSTASASAPVSAGDSSLAAANLGAVRTTSTSGAGAAAQRDTFKCSKFEPTSTLGARVGSPEESLTDALLKKLLTSSLEYGESEGVGWVLGLLTGEQGNNDDSKEILRQIQDANTSIGKLKDQINQLQTDLATDYRKLDISITEGTFATAIGPLNTTIADIDNIQIGFDQLVKRAGAAGPHYAFTGQDTTNLLDWRRRLTLDIENLRQDLNSDQPNAQTPIELYDSLIWKNLPNITAATDKRIMPSTYLDPAYDQVDYYSTVLVEAANLLSEVYHVSWPDYPADPALVQTYVKCANAVAQELSVDAAHGVGRVPADTVVDDRSPSAPRLWTNSPVSLDGDPGHTNMVNGDPAASTSDQAYCIAPSRYCLIHQYDQQGNIATTALARPTPGRLADLIAAQRPLGYGDWRIPNQADWTALETSATGGLTAWADPQSLHQFLATAVTSYHAGQNTKITVIPPVWVNTAGTTPNYQLLSSADPTANILTLHPAPADQVNATGGRLFLVRDLPPSDQPVTLSAPARKLSRTPTQASTEGAPETVTAPAECSTATGYHVPAGVYEVEVIATGGAGAPGLLYGKPAAKGGAAATVTANVPVTPGTTLYYQVGGAGNSTAGGIGGGGKPGLSTGTGDQSGGGGGATGLSSTPDCANWLIIAGGGGGGGGSHTSTAAPTIGGVGGDASTTPGTPTPGEDGRRDLTATTSSPGHGSPGTDGGAAGSLSPTNKIQPAAGTSGNKTRAGDGGNTTVATPGGGGGGGGGGYNSGGGGGGGLNAAGGGGGGGASFAMTAIGVTPTYTKSPDATNGSITITPIDSPITIQNSITGWTMNITGAQSADGTPLIQYPKESSANAEWVFRPDNGANNAGQLVNPATNKCATVTHSATVVLATCKTVDPATQTWTVTENLDDTTTLTSAVFQSDPTPRALTVPTGTPQPNQLSVYINNNQPEQHWALNPARWPAN